ncbi:MAG TPA: tetratricopeptide repeat protein [Thermoanaerobaculia bacterium]|nr:tetratricopeptide repeat protein [Thermoanaerobaculia bacterium]
MSQAASLRIPAAAERPAPVSGYATRDVAALLGLSVAQVRSYIRDGFLTPAQGARGEYRFSFQDLILLRTAKGLLAAKVPRRRIRLALQKLHQQLPEGKPLTGVRITAQGHHVVVRDGREMWNPESGQTLLDFDLGELQREAATLVPVSDVRRTKKKEPSKVEDWFFQGLELEAAEDPDGAIEAYRRALEIDAALPDVHLNIGRLLHEKGELAEAEHHYRRALELRPDEAVAAFNLGVALQDQERYAEAAEAYEATLALDGSFADAHYNLATVYEILGDRQAAFRHLKRYKSLIGG